MEGGKWRGEEEGRKEAKVVARRSEEDATGCDPRPPSAWESTRPIYRARNRLSRADEALREAQDRLEQELRDGEQRLEALRVEAFEQVGPWSRGRSREFEEAGDRVAVSYCFLGGEQTRLLARSRGVVEIAA